MQRIKISKIVIGLCLLIGMAWGLMTWLANNSEDIAILRPLAEWGYAKSQFNLGLAYAKGEGVAVDKHEAVKWYRKAAEQGYAEAQYNLGSAYWNGEGVIKDNREAYIWYSIANANGNKLTADNFREIKWRDFLSQSEIREAQKEAKKRFDAINNP